MNGAVVVIGFFVLVGIAFWALRFVQHPEDGGGQHHGDGTSDSDQLYGGDDRPAGPDAEDPPTAVPNRVEPQPPSGPAAP